jgi:hypothetical protein
MPQQADAHIYPGNTRQGGEWSGAEDVEMGYTEEDWEKFDDIEGKGREGKLKLANWDDNLASTTGTPQLCISLVEHIC